MTATRLDEHPIHLGLGASARVEPAFTGRLDWYEAYVARHAVDGAEGRLVTQHRFTEDWTMWEMHPRGAEVVLCIDGALTLVQEQPDGSHVKHHLGPGQYAINPAGVWHTADAGQPATVLFITAGEGTQHRPR